MAKKKAQPAFTGRSRVADLVPTLTKWGDYVKVSEITGADLLVVQIEDWRGTGDPAYIAKPSVAVAAKHADGKKVWFIVSHEVLYRKLTSVREDLPLVAKFVRPKGKRYFDVV